MQAAPPALWQIHRRPHGRMLAWVVILGFVIATVAAVMVQMLMLQPDRITGGIVGALLGVTFVGMLCQGAGTRVEAGAKLVYALRGHDCVIVDLREVTGFRWLQTGPLAGIAVDCPLDALTFVSRKGITRRQCETYLQRLGSPLILEFLRPEDLPPLIDAWHRSVNTAHPSD